MREVRLVNRRSRERYSVQRLGEFVARCRKRGIAVTPQRLAVIGALLASENHPSTDEICAAVRRRHPHVSLATVHRILEQFCEVGEARKVTLLHDVARFDGNVEPHHHVLCIKCRRVHDIEAPEVDKLLEGTPSLRCSLEIEALCRRCQLSEKRMQPNATPHQAETGGSVRAETSGSVVKRKKNRQVSERKSGVKGHVK
jgi:Fur family peroxide stress response transcriptional regulator